MYFSLGETLSLLGIVIAIYGILKPRWKLLLDLNKKLKISIVSLLLLGLVTSFVSFVLHAFTDLEIVAFSLQGLTYCLFLFSFIDFVRAIFWKKPLYLASQDESRKVEYIQRVLDAVLFSEKEEAINGVLTIVEDSLDEVCKDIETHPGFMPGEEEEDNLPAYFLNTLLSEKKVIEQIATKRLDFIEQLVKSIESNRVGKYRIMQAVDSLMTELYTNNESYFYQQLKYEGLYNYASAYDIVFRNEYFSSSHEPIAHWYNLSQKVHYKGKTLNNSNYIKVFLKAYTLSLRSFAYGHHPASQNLIRGMYNLADYSRSVSFLIYKMEEYDYYDENSKAFDEITQFVGHNFYFDVFKPKATKGEISAAELSPEPGQKKYHENLSSAFARLFVEVAEDITRTFGGEESDQERRFSIDLQNTFLDSITSYEHTQGVRDLILNMLWEKSYDNIEKGGFPAVFRVLAIMLYREHNNMPEWALKERNKLIDVLRKKLKPMILEEELMVNRRTKKEEALLPKNIVFNHRSKKFYSVDLWGNRTELKKINS